MNYVYGFLIALCIALIVLLVGAVWGSVEGIRSARKILAEHDHVCTEDCLDEKP